MSRKPNKVLIRAGSDGVIKTPPVAKVTQRQVSSAGTSRSQFNPPERFLTSPTIKGFLSPGNQNGSPVTTMNGSGRTNDRGSVKKSPLLPPARLLGRQSESSDSSASSVQSSGLPAGTSDAKRPLVPSSTRPAPSDTTSSLHHGNSNDTTCNGRLEITKPLPPTPPGGSRSPNNQSSPGNRSNNGSAMSFGEAVSTEREGERDVRDLESENEALKRRIMELEKQLHHRTAGDTPPIVSTVMATPTPHWGEDRRTELQPNHGESENLSTEQSAANEQGFTPHKGPRDTKGEQLAANEQGFTPHEGPRDPKVVAARIQLSRVIEKVRSASPDITTDTKTPPHTASSSGSAPTETAHSPSLTSPLSPLSPATPSPTASLVNFGLNSQAKRRAIKRHGNREDTTERTCSSDTSSNEQHTTLPSSPPDTREALATVREREERECVTGSPKLGQFTGRNNKSIVSAATKIFQADTPDKGSDDDDTNTNTGLSQVRADHTHNDVVYPEPLSAVERGKESLSSESDEVFMTSTTSPLPPPSLETAPVVVVTTKQTGWGKQRKAQSESQSPGRKLETERKRLGVNSKRTQLKSDVSWIKAKTEIPERSESPSLSQRSDSPSHPLQPYRSHQILNTCSPPPPLPPPPSHTVTHRIKHPLPQTHAPSSKPRHYGSQGLVADDENTRSRVASISEKKVGSKWKRQASKEEEGHMSRSMSDESLHGTIQRGVQAYASQRQDGVVKTKAGKLLTRPQPLTRHVSTEGSSHRPVSVLVQPNKPPATWRDDGREEDFTVSCTVPSVAKEKSPKRTFKKSSEPNPLAKKGSIFGRLRVKQRDKELPSIPSAATVVEEEEESDSSSEDEKGATIKFKPKLRPVSVRRPSQVEDDFDLTYPHLFERVFVVALKPDPATKKLVTEVTYTFPPRPPSETGRDETMEAIPQFCFPDIDKLKPTTKLKSETFSFVLTNIEGNRRFGYCRRLLPTGKGPRLPEVTCIVSPLGCFSLYEKILDHVESRRQISTTAVFTFLKAIVANPFPKPGRSVEVKAFSARGGGMETVKFTRPLDSRLEHVDFSLLFLTLTPRKIIQLFSSMLMERRIILCSDNLSLLTGCAHALLALLYPFEWQHVFIPVLPGALIDFCCSPLPYLMGMSPSLIPALDDMDTMEEALVVDLDRKKFVRKIGDEASILPSKLFQYLEHTLGSPTIAAEYQKPVGKRGGVCRADEIITNTIMIFFVYLYGDYKQFMQKKSDGSYEFKKKDFEKKFSSKSIKRFLEAFHMTQMFDSFAEQRENPLKLETTSQSTFERRTIHEMKDRCIEIEIFSSKSKISRWRLRKRI